MSEYTFPTILADGTYYWHVKAIGSESAFSTTDSFVIIPTFSQWTVIVLALTMGLFLWWRMK